MSKFKDSNKFKVGDVVKERYNKKYYFVITDMNNYSYFYDIFKIDGKPYHNPSFSYSIDRIEEDCDYYYKPIKATKLAKKIYCDRIWKEEGDIIWVKP